jgi:hypothetical protein
MKAQITGSRLSWVPRRPRRSQWLVLSL